MVAILQGHYKATTRPLQGHYKEASEVQVGAAEQPVSGSHSAGYFRGLSANDRTPQTSPNP